MRFQEFLLETDRSLRFQKSKLVTSPYFCFDSDRSLSLTIENKKSELEAARRSARGGAVMTSAVQEPTTAMIDEAVASISFPAVALPSTTMPTFFLAAVDGAVL